MLSVFPSTSLNDVPQREVPMDCAAPTSLFKLKHLEFFCGRIPIKIYFDQHSGVHYASVESPTTNLTNVSVNYVTYPFANGLPNVTAALALTGTEKGLAADRFDYYLGNIFSPRPIEVDVESSYTAFSFSLIGGTSGAVQCLTLLLDSLTDVTFGQRDFNHQIFSAENVSGKLYERLQSEETCLENVVDKARRSRTFHGSIFANDHVGTSDDLRSCYKLSKITQYFQSFYQEPWIMLAGNVLELDLNLLDTLLMKQSYATKYKRPNSKVANYAELMTNNPIPDVRFHYTDIVTVTGTSTLFDKGILQIGFLADSPANVTFLEAIDVVAEYLCGSKTSHLNEALAGDNNALCSSISIELNVAPRCEIVVQLNDVPKYFLNKGAVEKFFDALRTVRWDLQHLHEIIARKIHHYAELTEKNISSEVFERLRYFQLYADSDDALVLKRLLNPVLVLNELLQFSPIYWQNFVQRLFVENCTVVIGVPDNSPIQRHLLDPQLTPQHGNRDKRLRRSTELLKEIFKPSDTLFSQEIIDVATAPIFPFHQVFPTTFKAFHWNITGTKLNLLPEYFKSLKQFIDPSIPMSVTVHPIESEFVKAVFLFDIRSVELHLRYYILLFVKLLFNSSSSVNGNFMTVSEVKRAMGNELSTHDCEIGFSGKCRHILRLTFKVTASKLDFIEKWFHAIMCNSVFDIKDVIDVVHSLIGNQARKDGVLFCKTILKSVSLNQDNEDFYLNELVLEPIYVEMMQSFLNGSYQHVLDNLQSLRNQLLNAKISLHLVGSPKNFTSAHPLFFDDLKRFRINDKVDKIMIDPKSQPDCKWPSAAEFHIIGAKEFRSSSDFVERINVDCEPFDDVHVAILLLCEYFSRNGGIFWRCVKEDGQAQEASLSFDIHLRTLTLTVSGTKNPKATRQLIFYLLRQMFIDSLDSDLFKVSQRSLAAQIVEQYSAVDAAGLMYIFNDINEWTVDQITNFVRKILVINESRCQVLLYDLIAKMSAGKNLSAIVCPSYQVNHLMQGFQDILKPNLLVQHTNDEQFGLLSS